MSCHGLKMAYRNLLKYKLQSVICVLGLAGGLSCFTVCNYMLRKELAWNKQLPHYGETYKLVTIRENGEVDGLVSLDLAEQLKQEFPEIEKSVYYVGIVRVDTIIVQRHFFLFLHTFYPITFRVYHPGSE
jgi:putative ABC transport system permease protein